MSMWDGKELHGREIVNQWEVEYMRMNKTMKHCHLVEVQKMI